MSNTLIKLEIKAFNIIGEDWGEDINDFFISCQVDIGFKYEMGSEIYVLDVISPKRLLRLVEENDIEIGKGYFIMADYNKNLILKKIEKLIDKDISEDNKYNVFNEISVYFRSQI